MKRIIALYGRANCGKSETIHNVFKLLKAKYPSALITTLFSGPDIQIIMRDLNGLIVGLESQGDPNSRLAKSLDEFENAGCVIIFCTSRTRGMTIDWINSFKNKYHINWIKKLPVQSSLQSERNISDAQDLINLSGL